MPHETFDSAERSANLQGEDPETKFSMLNSVFALPSSMLVLAILPAFREGTSTKCRDIFQRRQCPGVEQLKAQDVIHEASVWHAMNCCVNLKNVSIETQLGLKDGPLVLGERSERSNI